MTDNILYLADYDVINGFWTNNFTNMTNSMKILNDDDKNELIKNINIINNNINNVECFHGYYNLDTKTLKLHTSHINGSQKDLIREQWDKKFNDNSWNIHFYHQCYGYLYENK